MGHTQKEILQPMLFRKANSLKYTGTIALIQQKECHDNVLYLKIVIDWIMFRMFKSNSLIIVYFYTEIKYLFKKST